MGKVNIDLGSIFGLWGDKTPQANPLYGAQYDEDSPTSWSYADGTPITDPNHVKQLEDSSFKNNSSGFTGTSTPDVAKQKFTTPSDWTQTFHPDVANYEQKANAASIQALTDAKNEQDVKNTINARQFDLARPAISGASLDNVNSTIGGILTGGNLSSQNINNVTGSQADLANNNPTITSDAQKQAELLRQEQAIKDRNALAQYQLMGGPSKENLNRVSTLDYDTARNIDNQYLLPRTTLNTSLHLGNDNAYQTSNVPLQRANDLALEQGRSETIPIQTRGAIARAQLETGSAESALTDMPLTNYAQHMGNVGRAYESNYVPPFGSPFMTQLHPDATASPNVRVPFTGLLDKANAQLGNGSSNQTTPPVAIINKNGKPGPMPPPSVYQPSSKPVMQGTTPNRSVNAISLKAAEAPNDDNSSVKSWLKEDEKSKVDQIPLQGRPGYTFDGDGNIYYEGTKVRMIAGSDITEEAKQQLQNMERDNLLRRAGVGYHPITQQ